MAKHLVEIEVLRKQTAVVVVDDEITNGVDNEHAHLVDRFIKEQAINQSHCLDAASFVDKERTSAVKGIKKLPDNLNSDQLHLISVGYPLDKVLALTADDAEGEVDAITYGPR